MKLKPLEQFRISRFDIFALVVSLSLLLLSQLVTANTQYLTYDNSTKQLTLTYDSLNRILKNNGSGVNITYTYDKQYNGTLSNITVGSSKYNYEYDNRLRVTREVRVIDGIQFEKKNYYDSMDRLVAQVFKPGQTINYTYNDQNKLSALLGFINSTSYDAFDNVLNRNYANSPNTQFTYDSKNERLTEIKTGSIQQLDYSYDKVGNVLAINDVANSRSYSMIYDFLDRLVNVTINNDTYGYVYNSIGNIMKMVRSTWSTNFAYGNNPVHAPSKIIPGNWANSTLFISSINPFVGDRINISCLIRDANTSVSIPNYKVSIYIDNNLTASNSSDASGWFNRSWVVTGGTHTIRCEIQDDLNKHYHNSSNAVMTLTPLIRGKIAFLCYSTTCSVGDESYIITWLKNKGWNVTSKIYSNWKETDFMNYDLIVCNDENYACRIDSTKAAYKVHKNNSKGIVEMSGTTMAKAAYYLGYIKQYSIGYLSKKNITVVASDPITNGYYGDVSILSTSHSMAKVPISSLNSSAVNLANLDSSNSGLFKVNQNGNQGRFAWLGWFYTSYPSDLTVDGEKILMRTLNWAQCGNASGCV
jgi:hypothetical protein